MPHGTAPQSAGSSEVIAAAVVVAVVADVVVAVAAVAVCICCFYVNRVVYRVAQNERSPLLVGSGVFPDFWLFANELI